MIHILLMAKRHKDTTVLRQGNEETESLRGWENE